MFHCQDVQEPFFFFFVIFAKCIGVKISAQPLIYTVVKEAEIQSVYESISTLGFCVYFFCGAETFSMSLVFRFVTSVISA